jgi:uncharacterized protein (TIGR02284 family)
MHYEEREKVNHLIEHLKDGEAGFLAAAEDALSPELKDVLMGYATQRAEFAEALQLLVEESGDKAEYTGTLGGAIHRGWINLKAALAKRTDLAILEECETAEDFTIAAYNKAQEGGLLEITESLVEEQATHIRQAHDEIKRLRDALRES